MDVLSMIMIFIVTPESDILYDVECDAQCGAN